MTSLLGQTAPTLNQALAGLIVVLPSLWLAWLAYKKSQKIDAITGKAGIIEAEATSTQVVLQGLDNIIQRLSDDNAQLRKSLDKQDAITASLREKLDKQDELITDLKTQIQDLRGKLAKAEKAAEARRNSTEEDKS